DIKKQRGDLPDPVYVQHRPYETTRFGNFVAGGAKPVSRDRQNNYDLFDTGRYDATPNAYEQGIARTIKHEVNWNTNTDLYERHAPPWNPANKADPRVFFSIKAATDELLRRGLNLQDWMPTDITLLRRHAERDMNNPARDTGARGGLDTPDVNEGEAMRAALNEAAPVDGVTFNTEGLESKYNNTRGFVLTP